MWLQYARNPATAQSSRPFVEELGKNPTPKWIEKEAGSFEAKIAAMPARDDIDYEVNEQLIVELYSK